MRKRLQFSSLPTASGGIARAAYARALEARLEVGPLLKSANLTTHQRSRLGEAEAAVAALTEARAQTAAEFRRTQFADLVEAERKAAGLGEDLIKATQRTHLQALTAPIDGTVQQLAVHTIGGVVRPGNEVEIKIDTFPFTRYGLIHGRVLSLSQDAIARDRPADKTTDRAPGAESSSSEPKGQELLYSARISLDRTQMQIEDSVVNLSAGMAATVEIKTGTRTLITYLLSPLLPYKHESLRER